MDQLQLLVNDTGLLVNGLLFWTQAGLSGLVLCWSAYRLWNRRALIPHAERRPVPWEFVDILPILLWTGVNIYFALWAGKPLAAAEQVPLETRFAQTIVFLLALVGGYAALLSLRTQANVGDLGVGTSSLGRKVGYGLLGYLAIFLPVILLQQLLVYGFDIRSEHPLVKELLAQPTPLGLGLGLFVFNVVIVAPLMEEFLYRVALQGWLEKALGGQTPWRHWLPIFLSAGLFAFAHLRLLDGKLQPDPLPLFVLALGLGYVYRQTHSLWPCVVMHAALNLSSSIIVALPIWFPR